MIFNDANNESNNHAREEICRVGVWPVGTEKGKGKFARPLDCENEGDLQKLRSFLLSSHWFGENIGDQPWPPLAQLIDDLGQ
jgi:hypothetical protein